MEVMLTALRMVHNQSPNPLVVVAMTMIWQNMDKEQPPTVDGELREVDVGCGRRPKTYLQRTSEFNFIRQWIRTRKVMPENMVPTLRKERFQFVEEEGKQGSWWQETSM